MPQGYDYYGRKKQSPRIISGAMDTDGRPPLDGGLTDGGKARLYSAGERSYDEATEGAIELVGRCAKELGIGASWVLAGGFGVLEITVLPVGETVGIRHLSFA